MIPFWKSFLHRYKSHGAHFHSEGEPAADLVLEMRPAPEIKDDWLWTARPPGFPITDVVKNEMCQEILKDFWSFLENLPADNTP